MCSNEAREARAFGVLAAEALFRADPELDALLEIAGGVAWMSAMPSFAHTSEGCEGKAARLSP